MPPWEYEEMGSVLGYLTDKITVISEEIADDLRKLCKATPCKYFSDVLPKEQRPPAPCEIESERDLIHFDDHFDGLAGLGPEFLYRILHTDRISRRNIICQNTRAFWAGPFIGLRIESLWEDRFPFIEPADLHETTYFEQLWSTLPPLEKPSVGWMKAWLVGYGPGNSLEESIDYDRQAETDWEWSYAIWDERRLEGWKAPFLSQDSQVEEPPSRVFYTTEYGEAVEGTSGRILL
ncbi:hypothetical protein N7462_008237 [Penicillium macrosclerotiorum]|uniref:uncharacterized protein n=1 Tax=Penicillium macrosclerotiorum TaxID=303699 RepID=UPI0025492876|nr:uncharacterized protein N7462_008237 [Penicillium macrosclerotiorum]KAJ5675340.1 hypothetical protein N7462_008237 [Penicillium macrosclerotiorum]